jgi:hypothetical protein
LKASLFFAIGGSVFAKEGRVPLDARNPEKAAA